LDFTTRTAASPKAEIGRLDFDLTYDSAGKTIKGTATLRLIPLGSDPLASGNSRSSDSVSRDSKNAGAPTIWPAIFFGKAATWMRRKLEPVT
jgi:hypothetical protein